MRVFGWPISESTTSYLDTPSSIVFRSADTTPVIMGEFIAPGDHVSKITINLGFPARTTYGIVIEVYDGAIRVFYQDGEDAVFLRNDFTVRLGAYTYEVGTPIWYNVFSDDPQMGTVLGFTGQHPDYETFSIQNTSTGETETVQFNNMVLRASVAGIIEQVECMYNVRPGIS